MSDATTRQKQFLRQLGHKGLDGLTKERASQLIDELLQAEKASGKTFPCPYCRKQFGPRPRRTKKCPSCGQTIVHLSGKFYTQAAVEEVDQKEWLKESRNDVKEDIKDDWREERSFRKEFGEIHFVGYILKIGPQCVSSRDLNGLLVRIEDAASTPGLLPPYDDCRHDTCECDFQPVSPGEVPKGTRVAEWSDPTKQAKLVSNSQSKAQSGQKKKTSGCAGLLLLGFSFVCFLLILVNRF